MTYTLLWLCYCDCTEVHACSVLQSLSSYFLLLVVYKQLKYCNIGDPMYNAPMALALSAYTPRVQFSVYHVSASWRSELGQDTPSGYLAISWNTCKLLY